MGTLDPRPRWRSGDAMLAWGAPPGPLTCHGQDCTLRPSGFPLEKQLERELNQARIACALHPAEVVPVGNVAVRDEELRVVKHVEQLCAELEPRPLSKRCGLEDANLKVTDALAAAN